MNKVGDCKAVKEGGKLLPSPGELGKEVKTEEPHRDGSGCPVVSGQPLEVSRWDLLSESPSLLGEARAVQNDVFGCLPLPTTGARR